MLRRVRLVRTDDSEERIACMIKVLVRFEVFTAVTTKNGVFWDVLRSVHRVLVTANAVPSSPILVTLMEALRSSETSVLTRATWRRILEDAILHQGSCS
jgi:hypothetical protein